jgi:hypothetical protein
MSKEKLNLDESGRVLAALNAAGRSTCVAAHLPAKYRQQLAALVSAEGVSVANIRDKVISVLRECGKENKAEGLLDKG